MFEMCSSAGKNEEMISLREENSRKRSNSFSAEQFFEGNPIRFDFIQKPHRFSKGGKFSATSFYGDEIVFPSMNRIFSSFTSRKSERKFTLPFLTQTIYRFSDAQVSLKGARVEKL
jgi:hypothetical protein